MVEQILDQALRNLLDNFTRYSRDGEILTLDSEEVHYDYIRSCNDPSYTGTLYDRTTFRKSDLIRLISEAISSPLKQASITIEGLKESFDCTESIYTGHDLGNLPSHVDKIDLELKFVEDIPVFRTDDMWSMEHLVEISERNN